MHLGWMGVDNLMSMWDGQVGMPEDALTAMQRVLASSQRVGYD